MPINIRNRRRVTLTVERLLKIKKTARWNDEKRQNVLLIFNWSRRNATAIQRASFFRSRLISHTLGLARIRQPDNDIGEFRRQLKSSLFQ